MSPVDLFPHTSHYFTLILFTRVPNRELMDTSAAARTAIPPVRKIYVLMETLNWAFDSFLLEIEDGFGGSGLGVSNTHSEFQTYSQELEDTVK